MMRGKFSRHCRSGKPVSVFAAVDTQRVYLWPRRLGGAERTTFQEVIVHRPEQRLASDAEGGAFEIALTSGIVVRVARSFDASALARMLEVLAQVRAC
jgi:hypothetical protein